MPSNSKHSEWYATRQAKRVRKKVTITLSDAARERVEALAKKRRQFVSAVIEALIMEAR